MANQGHHKIPYIPPPTEDAYSDIEMPFETKNDSNSDISEENNNLFQNPECDDCGKKYCEDYVNSCDASDSCQDFIQCLNYYGLQNPESYGICLMENPDDYGTEQLFILCMTKNCLKSCGLNRDECKSCIWQNCREKAASCYTDSDCVKVSICPVYCNGDYNCLKNCTKQQKDNKKYQDLDRCITKECRGQCL